MADNDNTRIETAVGVRYPTLEQSCRAIVINIIQGVIDDVRHGCPQATEYLDSRDFAGYCAWLNLDAAAVRENVLRQVGASAAKVDGRSRAVKYDWFDLYRQWQASGVNVTEFSRRQGMNKTMVHNAFRYLGLDISTANPYRHAPKKTEAEIRALYEAYLEAGLSVAQFAQTRGVNSTTLLGRWKELGLPLARNTRASKRNR